MRGKQQEATEAAHSVTTTVIACSEANRRGRKVKEEECACTYSHSKFLLSSGKISYSTKTLGPRKTPTFIKHAIQGSEEMGKKMSRKKRGQRNEEGVMPAVLWRNQ